MGRFFSLAGGAFEFPTSSEMTTEVSPFGVEEEDARSARLPVERGSMIAWFVSTRKWPELFLSTVAALRSGLGLV